MGLPIAIQLFSVRDTMSEDVQGTLIALKEMGYDGVEFAGLYGKTAQELKEMCDNIGLIPISSHIGFPSIRDDLERHIVDSVSLGVKYVAISSMHREFHIGGDQSEGVYNDLKNISARFAEKGIKLLYHNHSYEMIEFEGKRLHEWLFDIMSPDELQPELDTGWLQLEVGEAEQYIRKFKNRCDLVHVKSYYAKDGFDAIPHSPDTFKPRDTFDFCNYELGRLDVLAIVNASKESGAKWLVVEQDRTDAGLSELESAKINIDVLKRFN